MAIVCLNSDTQYLRPRFVSAMTSFLNSFPPGVGSFCVYTENNPGFMVQ
jgi:hypothetical protein